MQQPIHLRLSPRPVGFQAFSSSHGEARGLRSVLLPGRVSAVSTSSVGRLAFARQRVLRGVASCLFAIFGLVSATSTGAAQSQSNVDTLFEQARGEERTGDYIAAERTYKQALALAPENLEALKRMGVLLQTELRFDDSIQSFKQVLAIDPAYPGVNFFLGVSYFGKNDLGQSIESFDRELKTPTLTHVLI